jgi:hypothetical protein
MTLDKLKLKYKRQVAAIPLANSSLPRRMVASKTRSDASPWRETVFRNESEDRFSKTWSFADLKKPACSGTQASLVHRVSA